MIKNLKLRDVSASKKAKFYSQRRYIKRTSPNIDLNRCARFALLTLFANLCKPLEIP